MSQVPVSVMLWVPCFQGSELQSVERESGEVLMGQLQVSDGTVPLVGCQRESSLCDVERKTSQ